MGATAVVSRQELVGPGHKAPGGRAEGRPGGSEGGCARIPAGRARVWHTGPDLASQNLPAAGRSRPSQGQDPGPPRSGPCLPPGRLVLCRAPLPSSSTLESF